MLTIKTAEATDIPNIAKLLQKYEQDNNGGLFGNFPLKKVTAMVEEALTVIIACHDSKVIGVVFASLPQKDLPPILQAMLAVHPITANNYLYGPICIDEEFRGQGITQLMYQKLQQLLPNFRPLLFIAEDNLDSIRAHHKLGLTEKAKFTFNGQHFLIFSD
ncbi:GNAT family N-acetyltransferase [Entomomonas sp. E2T0]|uniref:GNAT family N-acetyltransferase n=1 Tax=Entomomonas sp. E2T0 TaxID=2930213 RepID=UPI0022284A7C|nr:GNAT family N-acetyltransferase [Entomomonas sp. E2T0]UYZ85383.1 GNAT family N-acetyltransferase [Entomomonas sp. E2T0]